MTLADDRPVRSYASRPAALGIGETCARRHQATFHEKTEGDTRLLPLVGYGLHCTFIERKSGGNSFACNFHVRTLTLDPYPAPTKPPGNGAGGPGAEEWIKDDVAGLRAGKQYSIEKSFGLLRRVRFRAILGFHALATRADRQ